MFYIPFCLICSNYTQRFLIRYRQRCRSFKTAKQKSHSVYAKLLHCSVAYVDAHCENHSMGKWYKPTFVTFWAFCVWHCFQSFYTEKRRPRFAGLNYADRLTRRFEDHGRFEEEDEEGKQNDVTPYRWYPWYWYINLNDCTRLRLAFENLKYCVTLSQRDIFFTLRENKQIAHNSKCCL